MEQAHNEIGHYSDASYQKLSEILEALKKQHASLLKLQLPTYSDSSSHPSPLLPTTAEEDGHRVPDRFSDSPAFSRMSKRHSIATTATESLNEWFDASEGNEGAQEFVLDAQTFGDASEPPSRMLTNESRSSLDHIDNSSIDTDIAEEEPPARKPSEDKGRPDPVTSALQVARRAYLPAPVIGDEGSLFSMLKKNVGKARASQISPYRVSHTPHTGPIDHCPSRIIQ